METTHSHVYRQNSPFFTRRSKHCLRESLLETCKRRGEEKMRETVRDMNNNQIFLDYNQKHGSDEEKLQEIDEPS